ncbi:MAG: lipase, partial [Alteromonas sp.]
MTLYNHLRSIRIRSTNPWLGKFAMILALFSMTLGLSGQAYAG